MSRRFRNDFINEESFGVEINPCAAVAATGVAMDNGFTYTQDNANTLQAQDIFEGAWLATHTVDDDDVIVLNTSFECFQFVLGQPIRFIADIHFVLLGTECNMFVGCIDDMGGATTITAGGGMKATGDHFGFYMPGSESVVFDNPASIFCVSQESGVAMITELTAANSIDRVAHVVTDTSRHQFLAEFVPTGPIGGTGGVTIFDADIEFKIDGVTVCVHHHTGANALTVADTELMDFGVYSENETDIITYNIRHLKCRQLRALSQFGG
jgi:hypothetical protein